PKHTSTFLPRGGASHRGGAVLLRILTPCLGAWQYRHSSSHAPGSISGSSPAAQPIPQPLLTTSVCASCLELPHRPAAPLPLCLLCCLRALSFSMSPSAFRLSACTGMGGANQLSRHLAWTCTGRVSVGASCSHVVSPIHLASSDDWRRALARVVPAVVVLRVTVVRAFDTESANSSYATGFIVDRRRGIILTNRHVVKPGPVVAEAMFLNREEVPVHPIYRDPVHDFGFFHFDPAAVQFLEYQDIPLAPESAAVGLEIRVVGNDSGEKVSILAGTIARLDRDAPVYKKDGYNDFNTFYLQAASGTKGGSSGSPVIDSRGCAVALNAGSKSSSASAFFLPLDRVVRALGAIQACFAEKEGGGFVVHTWRPPVVTRGTLQVTLIHKGFDETRLPTPPPLPPPFPPRHQVTLIHKGFDETRRLGLRRETEAEVRREAGAAETGLLVVDSLVPGGPAEGSLEPGDILVRVNGKVLTQFLALEAILDDAVGGTVTLDVERGGAPLSLALTVHDLHAVTPARFLELSGGVLHALSYQQARNFRFPCGLVYVAEPGYMLSRAGVPRFAIIQKLADEDVPDLEAFLRVFAGLKAGARVPIEYVTHGERHRPKSVLLLVDRHAWYAPPQMYCRDDSTGLWRIASALPPPPAAAVADSAAAAVADAAAAAAADGAAAVAADGDGEGKKEEEGLKKGGANIFEQQRGEKRARGEEEGEGEGSKKLKADETVVGDGNDPAAAAAAAADGSEPAKPAGTSSLVESALEPAFVMMEVHVPSSVMVDGVHAQHFFGTALVVHHTPHLGLIVVDRNTVAVSVSDIMLSFSAYPVEVPGEVVFLHPVHNFAFVAYDPSALGAAAAAAVKPATLKPSPPLRRGDRVHLVGLSRSQAVTSRQSVVTNPTATLTVGAADCPRYRSINMDVVEIDTDFGQSFSGVLADDSGAVRALWGSFSTFLKYGDGGTDDLQFVRGLPISFISAALHQIIHASPSKPLRTLPPTTPSPTPALPTAPHVESNGQAGEAGEGEAGTDNSLLMNGRLWAMPRMRVLEAELAPMLLSKARSFGLSEQWVHLLARADPVRRQVLRVKGTLAGSAVAGVLQQGDMLLAVNGRPVTCFADVEAACCELDAGLVAGDGGSGGREGAGNGHVSETGGREPTGSAAAGAEMTAANGTAEAAVGAPGSADGKESGGEAGRACLSLTILRQGREQQVQAGTDVRHGFGTTRVVNWAGCLVQDPHPAVRATGFLPSQGHGAYVARWCHGSPAHRYGLYALHWIVEINGHPVPDLDALVAISQELEHGAFVGFFAPSAAPPAGQSGAQPARDPSAAAADGDGLPPLPFLASASPSPPFVSSVPPIPSLPINVPLPSYQRPSPIAEGSECSESLPPDDSYLSSSATSAAPSGAVFGSVSDVSGPILSVSAATVARAGATAAQQKAADGAKPSREKQAGAPGRGAASGVGGAGGAAGAAGGAAGAGRSPADSSSSAGGSPRSAGSLGVRGAAKAASAVVPASLPTVIAGGKKVTSKAERRALQEAQRAAKAAAAAGAAGGGGGKGGKGAGGAGGGGGKGGKGKEGGQQGGGRRASGESAAVSAAGTGGGDAEGGGRSSSGSVAGAQKGGGGGGGKGGGGRGGEDGQHKSSSLRGGWQQLMADVAAVDSSLRVDLFRHLPQFDRAAQIALVEARLLDEEDSPLSVHPAVYEVGMRFLQQEQRLQGGNERCLAMLHALRRLFLDHRVPDARPPIRDLTARLNAHVAFLIACRPLSVGMGNAVRALKQCLTRMGADPGVQEGAARAAVVAEIDRFVAEKLVFAGQEVVRHAAGKIRKEGDVILTFGWSELVLEVLLSAARAGHRFRAIVVDSRPHLEGKEMVRRLLTGGISCLYLRLNAASYIMKDVTRVFLGAAAVLANGAAYARVGTAAVAMMAHAQRVPVLVCCESSKFHERVQLDSITHNEIGDPQVLISTGVSPLSPTSPLPSDASEASEAAEAAPLQHWQSTPNLRPLNIQFDLTPADYITGIVTEIGVVPTSSVPVILRECRNQPF
ncbi:unnamed protein product, partial [Closterium sp. NIES-54]